MRLRIALVVGLLVMAACGDGDSLPATTSTTAAPDTATTTGAAPDTPPAVLAIVSGRGDDGSLEIGVWFDSNPLVPGAVLIVGIDSDDSYPGVGNVRPHLDGLALFSPTATVVDVIVTSDGQVVAGSAAGDSDEWVSWAAEREIMRVFFVKDVATRAGSVWVLAMVGNASSPLGTAGVPLGDSCSHVGSGVDVTEPPGGVPDAGRTCRYP